MRVTIFATDVLVEELVEEGDRPVRLKDDAVGVPVWVVLCRVSHGQDAVLGLPKALGDEGEDGAAGVGRSAEGIQGPCIVVDPG